VSGLNEISIAAARIGNAKNEKSDLVERSTRSLESMERILIFHLEDQT
jgi:hypothetical protein